MVWDRLNTDIGDRIRYLRDLHHITQEQLAESLQLSIKHISEVERGLSCLSLERLIELCEILDTSLDYLVLGKSSLGEEVFIPASVIEVMRSGSEAEKRILNEYLLMYERLHKSPAIEK